VAGATIILDLIGPERLRAFGRSEKHFDKLFGAI
jgi:hypothetical protein